MTSEALNGTATVLGYDFGYRGYRMPVWSGGVTVVKKVTRPAGNEGRTCFAYIVAPSLADIEDALKHRGLQFRGAQ